ncbi:eugenol synthase 1-like [Salvia miltiorrhiza]|uniref:eugenol synthase 1-like n=1 Tax=Salvia miltiorrhiza TaxID=226208 RepID=UPI0025ABCAD0|nr:eugenol synthase 1-like [Salvia miltiorrhiza]
MKQNESRILIFGGTGYIGSYMVKASIKLGHPTYVFTRPDSNKTDILTEFQSMGAIIVKGRVDEHDKLVAAVREVDVVISALAYPQVLDQLKILEAIKIAGNIKRFLPSDFGLEEDRVSALPPFEAFLNKKRRIRRAIEEAKIPYTFVSANCFGAYFINYLLHPSHPNKQDITVYGSGEAKAVLIYEEDIGIYTIKVATDPRTCNRVVVYRPPANVVSQLDLISLWEKKTGRFLNKTHITEQEIVTLSQSLPDPENIPVSILHSVFVKGATADFEIGDDLVEASPLYPELKFSTVDQLIDIFLKNPIKPASAAFG